MSWRKVTGDPQVGDMARHRSGQLDDRRVVAVDLPNQQVDIHLATGFPFTVKIRRYHFYREESP